MVLVLSSSIYIYYYSCGFDEWERTRECLDPYIIMIIILFEVTQQQQQQQQQGKYTQLFLPQQQDTYKLHDFLHLTFLLFELFKIEFRFDIVPCFVICYVIVHKQQHKQQRQQQYNRIFVVTVWTFVVVAKEPPLVVVQVGVCCGHYRPRYIVVHGWCLFDSCLNCLKS